MQALSPSTDSNLLALRALGHATRLAAYRALVQVGPDGMAVGALRSQLEMPAATLSAHLNVLRAAGLVVDAREGRVIRVHADYARMNALIAYLTENCCMGSGCDAMPCDPNAVCDPTRPEVSPTRRSKSSP